VHISTDVSIVVDHKYRRFGRIIEVLRFILPEQVIHPVRSRCLHRSRCHAGLRFACPHRQIDGKDSSLPFVALHFDDSAMYLYKRFYQCQPDTGTGMMPVDLIETVEDAADMFCRNQTPGIGHRKTEERSALFLQSRKPDNDFTILGGELERITQQIEVDTLHLLSIRQSVVIGTGHAVERKMDMLPPGGCLKRIVPLSEALQQIEQDRGKLHLSRLVFAKIEYLIDQTQQDLHVALHQQQHPAPVTLQ